MASHTELYTSMPLWELLFAPALCQKYVIWGLYRADAAIGGPAIKTINWVQAKLAAKLDDIHPTGLTDPEEDYLGLFPFDGCFSQKYLKNRNLSEVIYAQKKATENVFIKKNIPFRSFEIKKRDEKTLGELFCFFILETILIGKSLNLNPYDQPAVELIKLETKRILT